MNRKNASMSSRWLTLAVLVAVILLLLGPAHAAVQVQRPITDTGGRIDQTYLWGTLYDNLGPHKGLDFPYGAGIHVHAIADGTVVNLREDLASGQGSKLGNFVLIRHTILHWDRTVQPPRRAYVYSIYGHLQQNSVRYNVDQFVRAGTWIAQVDNTGTSTGNHLHLQICLHPEADRTIYPVDTLDYNNTSRNPELWLQPFSHGTNTGTRRPGFRQQWQRRGRPAHLWPVQAYRSRRQRLFVLRQSYLRLPLGASG